MANSYNPIISVDGEKIPCPSSYKFKREDVSSSDAGRTQDGIMHKLMIGTTFGIELEWQNVTTDVVHKVLKAFRPEYTTVVYINPDNGDPSTDPPYQKSDVFYTGNRSAPMYNSRMGLWENLALNIIRKGVDD